MFTLVGLEAQLLGIVVKKESPELEKQKDDLVLKIAAGKKKLVELEDKILRCANQTHPHQHVLIKIKNNSSNLTKYGTD